MINESQIASWIDEHLNGTDLFLVELKVKTDNKIRVFIDSEKGVSIDNCMALSRYIEHRLDRDQEDFALDVSSAGLDLPLRVPRQFTKNIGRALRVLKNDGQVIEGILTDFDGIVLNLTPLPTKKKGRSEPAEIQPVQVPLSEQKETTIIITF